MRESKEQIDYPLIQQALDRLELGLPSKPLPDSPAKRRLATTLMAKTVIIALTAGMSPVEGVTMSTRGGHLGRIRFAPQVSCSEATPITLKLLLRMMFVAMPT